MTQLALITGGQRGIGLGIAKALIAEGWHIAIASLPDPSDLEVREALETLGPNARYYQHDLSDVSRASALATEIENQQGPVTSLISNAGVPAKIRGDMLDLLPENWDFTLDINLKGTFFLAQAVARGMTEQQADTYRSLIFVTSVSAEMVSIERAEYCVSKAGASMVAELFAIRLAQENIGVFELRPGIIETPMTAGVKDKYTARIEGGLVPAGRWGQPADIGQTVLPLVSGQMQFATGTIIPVDGGLSIHRL